MEAGGFSVLGHVLAAEDAEAAELHAVLAGLNDDEGGAVLCLLSRDDVAGPEAPGGDGALEGGVPCAEPGLWAGLIVVEDGGEVDEGVAEQPGAALDGGVLRGVDRRDLDGIGQGVRQIDLRRARRHA